MTQLTKDTINACVKGQLQRECGQLQRETVTAENVHNSADMAAAQSSAPRS